MLQQLNSNSKVIAFRKQLSTIIADNHEGTLSKFGAIISQGLLEAGGRNVTIRSCRDHGHMDATTVAGLFVFTQVRRRAREEGHTTTDAKTSHTNSFGSGFH